MVLFISKAFSPKKKIITQPCSAFKRPSLYGSLNYVTDSVRCLNMRKYKCSQRLRCYNISKLMACYASDGPFEAHQSCPGWFRNVA
jgi:hypothetical protein